MGSQNYIVLACLDLRTVFAVIRVIQTNTSIMIFKSAYTILKGGVLKVKGMCFNCLRN